ncbi:transglutaminase family protein [Aquimarina brevivitae]|uniref:Transglutaminase-like putative cysteine protease n=1 Tax=Aquimarina brevivitae TaxID=323412 RepID=A0A4Q7P1S1_9FLAO|nr:transglutaminase family protein [Aquimarina brevivitae]RZS93806.1 transglutaminase-like putative cysteine protease [Aquimarina brevivitae]
MKFKITHQTDYTFDKAVMLNPHEFRFLQKSNSYMEVEQFTMVIDPLPKFHRVIQDVDHNTVDMCWFGEETKALRIHTTSILNIKAFNPFDFIIYPPSFSKLPFQYEPLQNKILGESLVYEPLPKILQDYGSTILQEAQYNTVQFLSDLTKAIHRDFKVVYRAEGPPLAPGETYSLKEGSCRDLSWMLINLFRHFGIAARFVSGYFYFKMEKPAYELHGWVEVYLPGAGWIGMDPSHGIFTGNTHFPIASSAYPQNTLPVMGSIQAKTTSTLATQLSIQEL